MFFVGLFLRAVGRKLPLDQRSQRDEGKSEEGRTAFLCTGPLIQDRRKRISLFGRFIACISIYLSAKFKIVYQGEVCKIDKPLSLSVKTLKSITLEEMENGIFFSNLKYLQLI